MNKELSDVSKSRLYALTAIVCAAWLGQSIYQTIEKGQQVFTVLNIIFYLSILLVVVYTSYSAYEMWKLTKNKSKTDSKKSE